MRKFLEQNAKFTAVAKDQSIIKCLWANTIQKSLNDTSWSFGD